MTEENNGDTMCVYKVYTHSITIIFNKGSDKLDIIINNMSSTKLYEQIKNSIKSNILNGSLKQGELLPSIRSLAKDLKVSIITVKRAYEDLENEKYIETVVGKGTFVSQYNSERLRETALYEMENKFEAVVSSAKSLGVSLDECIDILKNLYKEV